MNYKTIKFPASLDVDTIGTFNEFRDQFPRTRAEYSKIILDIIHRQLFQIRQKQTKIRFYGGEAYGVSIYGIHTIYLNGVYVKTYYDRYRVPFAVEYCDKKNRLHNVNGPALFVVNDGEILVEWYVHGKRGNLNEYDISSFRSTATEITVEWWKNGKMHGNPTYGFFRETKVINSHILREWYSEDGKYAISHSTVNGIVKTIEILSYKKDYRIITHIKDDEYLDTIAVKNTIRESRMKKWGVVVSTEERIRSSSRFKNLSVPPTGQQFQVSVYVSWESKYFFDERRDEITREIFANQIIYNDKKRKKFMEIMMRRELRI